MESSPTTIAPILIRNILTSLFIYADKSLLNLGERYKLLEFIRHLVATFFLFFLRFLPSLFPRLNPFQSEHYAFKSAKGGSLFPAITGPPAADSGIARALSQLLSIVNDIPVSSRKYEVVRSLAERLIDENQKENVEALRQVNRMVLSAAFSRTLSQLEGTMVELGGTDGAQPAVEGGSGNLPVRSGLNRVLRKVQSVRDGVLSRVWRTKEEVNRSRISAEKLAAELLWLAQKMAACGFAEEAVEKWARASNLGWLALSAGPRLQGSLIEVSAFLFNQAKDMVEESEEDRQKLGEIKMKMLMAWLPLLCRGSSGTDSPVLSMNERSELEKTLEEAIEELEGEEAQEQVLSLWLHHFTYCPSSDWPNLLASYVRWCTASRKLLLLQ